MSRSTNRSATLLTSLLLGLLVAPAARAGRLFSADLDGAQMVPPVDTQATGHMDLYMSSDEQKIWVELKVTNLVNPMTASHVHLGAPGENGPQFFDLGVFTDSTAQEFPLGAIARAALKAGNMYAAVHTAPYPVGEIRGQLYQQPCRSFLANLNGAQEVPPTNSQATGVADLTEWGDHSRVHLVLRLTNWTQNMTACHIHKAPPGVIGPHIFDLGIFQDRLVKVLAPTQAQLSDLTAGLWYIQVHSGVFPTGEIRGQFGQNTPAAIPGGDPRAEDASSAPRLSITPNPITSDAILAFTLSRGGAVRMTVLDASGRVVRSDRAIEVPAGAVALHWDGRDDEARALPSGVYFARVETPEGVTTRSVQLLGGRD
ncbi:MAG: CHRD domain-containing protein [Candidatus Eisenbacteria bacterium]